MSYWYLASPYTRYPGGREAAYKLALENTALLMRAGVPVFSPIVHTYPLEIDAGLRDFEHKDWMNVDRPMFEAAKGGIILRGDGWTRSTGMQQEIGYFHMFSKPVIYMDPGVVPFPLTEIHARAA